MLPISLLHGKRAEERGDQVERSSQPPVSLRPGSEDSRRQADEHSVAIGELESDPEGSLWVEALAVLAIATRDNVTHPRIGELALRLEKPIENAMMLKIRTVTFLE